MTPMPGDLTARLAEVLGPDRLGTDDPALSAIDGLVPRAVVAPRSAGETARALAFASERGLAVGVLGGGTRRRLGNPPARLDVVLLTRALDAVTEYEPTDFVITAQAGISLTALAAVTAPHGQMLSLDPPALPGSTLGGALSADASGPRRFLHGTARDLVIGIEAALPDGTVVRSGGRVVKNVAGYDLKKLFLGAIGTLGVITASSLKLHAIPEDERFLAAGFARAPDAAACAARLLYAGLDLGALDLANGALAAVAGGDPGLWTLALSIAGAASSTAAQAEEALALCRRAGASSTQMHSGDEARAACDRLRAASLAGTDEVALRAGVPVGNTVPFAAEMEKSLAPLGMPRIGARAGNGIVTALLRAGAPGPIAAAAEEIRERAGALGGSLAIESAPPEVKRAIEVWGAPAPLTRLSARVKEAFDPRGVMAPGRLPGPIRPGGVA